MEYSILKLIHIGALVLWLGPAFGAWVVLNTIEDGAQGPIAAKVNKAFFWMITLEHLAFVVLLTTGLWMAYSTGWFASAWLQQKLVIVGLIIIPLEIIDILLGNYLAAKASKAKYLGQASEQQLYWLRLYHGPFTKLAIVIIPLAVTLVMFLAVSKMPLL